MTEALYALVLLACPVGMGLMMWFMMRGGKQPRPILPAPSLVPSTAGAAELAALRAEVDQLRAEQRDSHHRSDVVAPPGGTDSR